jgi:hypothetical protein
MCLYPRASTDMYWSKESGDPFVQNSGMTREDWVDINVALFHLDNELIEFLETGLNNNFRHYWNPARRVVIDESMRKFKGKEKMHFWVMFILL